MCIVAVDMVSLKSEDLQNWNFVVYLFGESIVLVGRDSKLVIIFS
jgi:hypothetical protein